jgi:homoserine dehydrogenase
MRVALLGAGTVGREVVRAFTDFPDRLRTHDGVGLELAGVAVRDLARRRDLGIDPALVTDAPAHLVADPDTDVVVEVMGGDEPARTLIAAALAAGKPVVTANKHVVAHHGPELEAISRRTAAALRFEAAVAGGTPVLGPLAVELAADRIDRVRGIVNGTTNYILSAMADEARPYAEVLAAAQAAGYAEADPSADVEGDDAVNKLVILIRLAFGTWVDPSAVVRRPATGDPSRHGRPGITGVTAAEIAGAAALGRTIKLIAEARRLPDGRVAASVLPTLIPLTDPMGRTDGVTNRVEIRAEPVGDVAFVGPGAGGGATSSAVLGDLLAIARGVGSTWAGLAPAGTAPPGILTGPPESAPDRGWFALVPGDAPRAHRAEDQVAAATAHGTAIILRRMALADARAAFRAAGLPPDAPILPADEPAAVR